MGMTVAGPVLFLMGLPFLAIFFPWRLADDLRLDRRGEEAARGIVVRVEETRLRENNRRVYRYEFEYDAGDGTRRAGRCHETGRSHAAGAGVPVEFLPGDPSVARIRGTRRSQGSRGAVMVALFPLAGAVLSALGLRMRGRLLRLLALGRFAAGRIERVEPTPTRVNGQPVHKVFVAFSLPDGPRVSSYRAYGPDLDAAREQQAADAPVGVLYDPDAPERIFPVARLVGPFGP